MILTLDVNWCDRPTIYLFVRANNNGSIKHYARMSAVRVSANVTTIQIYWTSEIYRHDNNKTFKMWVKDQ